MPVPESYASRRYGSGRDENIYSSGLRSATRPGLINSAYTSTKLSSSTLPPRSTFERKLSSGDSVAGRYLSAGSRTIPAYGSSLRGSSSSPVRTSTTPTFRREGATSVADRIKTFDLSNGGERDYTSRFLRTSREVSVVPIVTSRSNGYLGRERSGSRELGISSGVLNVPRERNVRANIAARAASIGPAVVGRSSRNGHSSSSISHQNSTEVTSNSSTSKSNNSSPLSSANASRGITPPGPPVTEYSIANNAERDGGVNKLKSKTVTATAAAILSANGVVGINGNESNRAREVGQSVKMVTETTATDSNGNALIQIGERDSEVSLAAESIITGSATHSTFPKVDLKTPKVIYHRIKLIQDNPEGSKKLEEMKKKTLSTSGSKISEEREAAGLDVSTSFPPGDRKYLDNQSDSTQSKSNQFDGSQSSNIAISKSQSTIPISKTSPMTKYQSRRKSGSHIVAVSKESSTFGSPPSKYFPSILTAEEEDALRRRGSPSASTSIPDHSRYNQCPSPLRQITNTLRRSPSPGQVTTASSTGVIHQVADDNLAGQLSSPARTPRVLPRVPSASREPSLSRSPTPPPLNIKIPTPPPQPADLYSNNNGNVGVNAGGSVAMTARRYGDSGPSSSRNPAPGSSDSDQDADNYTSSPTLDRGRFRSSVEKHEVEKEVAGLSGLRNIGNTCFMNSVLQCLSNTKPLLEYVSRKGYSSDINTTTSAMKGALIRAFADVVHELWRETRSTVDTSAFKDQIQRFAPRFMGYSQQDAQEFLRYLLEGLHEDINRVISKPKPLLTDVEESLSDTQKGTESWKRYLRGDDSKIVDLFVGQLKSTLKCTTCGHCSVTFDPFWDLSLPIPSKIGSVKLSQCLELFTKEEVLDGDEKPTCSKCATRRKCTKSFTIQRFPKILVIHLKRFSPTERYRGKLSTTIDFPLQGLDMTPYAANRSLGCTYNLYGVANHSGSTYSGHYVAYCKHPYNGEWYCYNDSRVSPLSSQYVVSSDGYVLFYELKSSSQF